MNKIEDGGPAFPTSIKWGAEGGVGFHGDEAGKPNSTTHYSGMTLRQYAAIKLRVPSSGTDWLDDMIRASLRDELAKKVLPACYTEFYRGADDEDFAGDWCSRIMKASYRIADSMLQEGQNAEGNE